MQPRERVPLRPKQDNDHRAGLPIGTGALVRESVRIDGTTPLAVSGGVIFRIDIIRNRTGTTTQTILGTANGRTLMMRATQCRDHRAFHVGRVDIRCGILAVTIHGGCVFKQLDIDYYRGAYGATLRLATDEIDDLRTLNALFRLVREDRTVDLASLAGTRVENVHSIQLRRAAGRSKIKQLETLIGPAAFEWTQDIEGWLESAELIEGMINENRPGHQYLTRAGQGDILVEVAFQEE